MTSPLLFLAGKSAYKHVRENGLSQSDIQMVLGASGAAKWLVIYGLDSVLFSKWFANRSQPLHLFGTSIGAWKFAAATQASPFDALKRLKDAYINQYYGNSGGLERIAWETERITKYFIPENAIRQILSHPVLRIGFSAVRCKGLIASNNFLKQGGGLLAAYISNLVSRSSQTLYFERVLFHHADYDTDLINMGDLPLTRVGLCRDNFEKALLASGSIPMIMNGVKEIPFAPAGVYRDGGLVDYHPSFSLNAGKKGLILYPHFYPEVILSWFDKKNSLRRANAQIMDRTILLVPNPEFVKNLPYRRIPDRQDFIRLKGKDDERIRAWKKVADMSNILGHAFMDAVETGKVRDLVRSFPLSSSINP